MGRSHLKMLFFYLPAPATESSMELSQTGEGGKRGRKGAYERESTGPPDRARARESVCVREFDPFDTCRARECECVCGSLILQMHACMHVCVCVCVCVASDRIY